MLFFIHCSYLYENGFHQLDFNLEFRRMENGLKMDEDPFSEGNALFFRE